MNLLHMTLQVAFDIAQTTASLQCIAQCADRLYKEVNEQLLHLVSKVGDIQRSARQVMPCSLTKALETTYDCLNANRKNILLSHVIVAS